MDCTLLTYAFVIGTVKVQGSEWAVVPVEYTCDADDSIDIELIVSKIEFFKSHSLLLVAGEE